MIDTTDQVFPSVSVWRVVNEESYREQIHTTNLGVRHIDGGGNTGSGSALLISNISHHLPAPPSETILNFYKTSSCLVRRKERRISNETKGKSKI